MLSRPAATMVPAQVPGRRDMLSNVAWNAATPHAGGRYLNSPKTAPGNFPQLRGTKIPDQRDIWLCFALC